MVVTAKLPAEPTVKVAWLALVMAGDSFDRQREDLASPTG